MYLTISGLGWEFESSVNPIPTKGSDYAHLITDCPPNPPTRIQKPNNISKFLVRAQGKIVCGRGISLALE